LFRSDWRLAFGRGKGSCWFAQSGGNWQHEFNPQSEWFTIQHDWNGKSNRDRERYGNQYLNAQSIWQKGLNRCVVPSGAKPAGMELLTRYGG